MTTAAATHILDIAPLTGCKTTVPIEIPEELTVLEGLAQPEAGHCTFRILHPMFGDKRITWQSTVLQQINAAKEVFLKLVKEGLVPHKVGVNGQMSSEVMREFDPRAEEIIFVPTALLRGG